MGKDTRLVNIYLNIHNKRPLTMDDLRYLAQYAPDCFEKTCKNVIYNIPEVKPILEPETTKSPDPKTKPQPVEQPSINVILDNLKRLETDEFPIANIAADEVKSLLGNLYMELLFPHNDRDTFFDMTDTEKTSSFDARA
uniref:hypothetical protein n=1 Tax=Acetatifactor sp. TaxID=1872090 RepID=UPI004056965B